MPNHQICRLNGVLSLTILFGVFTVYSHIKIYIRYILIKNTLSISKTIFLFIKYNFKVNKYI